MTLALGELPTALAAASGAGVSDASLRVALLALLVALVLVLFGVLIRMRRLRKTEGTVAPADPDGPPAARLPAPVAPPVALAPARPLDSGAGGGLAVAAPEPSASPSGHGGRMACPSCRREYEPGVRFCTHDSRRLVPLGEVVARSRVPGSVCPRCRRAFDAGTRFCPHDSEELMSAPIWEATHGRKHSGEPTGVIAKICPQCTARYDLATAFCGRDGTELMTIN